MTIQETISRPLLLYTFECESVHDILVALMNRIALTDRARQLDTSTRYQHLKKFPKNHNIETWLQQWECTYAECKKLSLPDVQNDCAIYDFLQAISSLALDFSSI